MARIGWLTDIHLNFVNEEVFEKLCREVAESRVDALLIGGDIAEAPSLEEWLKRLSRCLQIPIHFVLGNHDFYKGGIEEVESIAASISRSDPHLGWLPASKVVRLSKTSAIIGEGGWGDMRCGNTDNTPILLNDFIRIKDLTGRSFSSLQKKLRSLGDRSASRLEVPLKSALQRFDHLVVLMHVPPFEEACWYEGVAGHPDWAPFFVCVALGELLKRTMKRHPEKQMTVLCGHTHGSGVAQILPNLRVHTGAATYRSPALQPLILDL